MLFYIGTFIKPRPSNETLNVSPTVAPLAEARVRAPQYLLGYVDVASCPVPLCVRLLVYCCDDIAIKDPFVAFVVDERNRTSVG